MTDNLPPDVRELVERLREATAEEWTLKMPLGALHLYCDIKDAAQALLNAYAVVEAARTMPRKTPAAGGAETVHDFKIPAHAVWALDKALNSFDATLKEGSNHE